MEEFNKFFNDKPLTIHSNISKSVLNYDYLISCNNKSMLMEKTSSEEIRKIICNLNNKGGDIVMPVRFVKMINPFICKLLADIFNLCMEQGCYPGSLKVARIVPVFKKGDVLLVTNYRPISILPVLNKIFEKLIYVRVSKFFSECNLLSENQFGFTKGRDTQQATLKLIHNLIEMGDKQQCAACVFLDFSAAFDTIDRNLLNCKLDRYGIRGPALKLIMSYLTDRQQYVGNNNCKSSAINCNLGVPQGSVLGPLFFIIYTNDINYLLQGVLQILFADDTSLVISSKCPELLALNVNLVLGRIMDWCNYNRLSLNPGKTKCILFNVRKNLVPKIYINNSEVEIVTRFKYLGFVIDKRLTHKYHVNAIISKLKKFKYITFKLSKYMTVSSAKIFYYGMIFSNLNYGLLVWGGTISTVDFKKLEKLQNKIVFNLFHRQDDTTINVSKIYKRHKILKLADIYKLYVCIAVYRILSDEHYLSFYRDTLVDLAFNHNYETRNRFNYRIPVPRSRKIKLNFIYQAIKTWNSLDIELRNLPNLNMFKCRVRNCIFSLY